MNTPNQLLWQEVDGEVLPPDPQDLPEGDPNAPLWTPQDDIMPHDPSSTPAAPNFNQRNHYLRKLVIPKGTLSQLGAREGDQQLRGSGFMPPRLAEHKRQKGDRTSSNYDKLQDDFKRDLASACGACALSSECSLANDPDKFRGRFYAAGARQKLVRRLDNPSKSDVKCDDITQSK
jgi:hypothetical protein